MIVNHSLQLSKSSKKVHSSSHATETSPSLCKEVCAMRDGHLEASGNWVEGTDSFFIAKGAYGTEKEE
jgi:hypothetical protein